MCGICGFSWKDDDALGRMVQVISHRGPDQTGVYSDNHASLGHRRLSIIDLSEAGRQPMTNEDRTVWLVFNGEIYNFQEVREALLKKGHRFASKTDSEVIIHAYEEYGTDAVNVFRGMFAFALWDTRKQLFWLARDRIGIKPLYYYAKNGKLAFASEIKSILTCPEVQPRINHQAVYDYLGFEFVPAPETMFGDIYKLPAGFHLVWQAGRAEIKPYWDLSFKPGNFAGRTQEDVAREIIALLGDCVKSHLISDVPLGVFLSGGLDSSTLVALMRQHIPGRLRTFTIGFPDATFSELDYAKIVADHLATDHTVLMIDDVTEADVESSLWHFDEPMTDLSSIPLMMVCKKAKQHVTVCLSGEGGDEVFAGYDRFKASKINRIYSSLVPRFLRQPLIANVVKSFPDRPQKKGAINMFKRFIEGSALPEDGQQLRWQYFLHQELVDGLFSDGFREHVAFDPFRLIRDYNARCDAQDTLNRELYLDTRYEMADSVLMKVDKMSMASALEVRVPFLDHKFVEFNASLPGDWKMNGFKTKYIFRKAIEGLLPDAIIHRGKQGYSLPVKNLLRDQLRGYMTDLLNSSQVIRENMNIAYVNQLIREHIDMKHNHNHVLWGLINVAIWHRKFFRA